MFPHCRDHSMDPYLPGYICVAFRVHELFFLWHSIVENKIIVPGLPNYLSRFSIFEPANELTFGKKVDS